MAPKGSILYIMFILAMILSACSGTTSTEDKIYEHLEEAVRLESSFEEQQNDITALEKEEQEIYSQIIELDMSEFDKIKDSAQQAIEIIETRSEKIEIEKESINSSQEEFEKINSLIGELKEQDVKDKAEEMYSVMMDRYDAYDAMHEAYLRSLEEEEKLYTLLQNEDVTEDDLKDQIAIINNTYQEVLDGNDQFNTNTVTYNELKKEFYEVANINVQYDEG